jgi:hypothetical protein
MQEDCVAEIFQCSKMFNFRSNASELCLDFRLFHFGLDIYPGFEVLVVFLSNFRQMTGRYCKSDHEHQHFSNELITVVK